jgi:predicted nucleic acid-binding protein
VKTIFLDTVGLVAVWDEDDQWHAAADAVFRALVRNRLRLITTTLVMYECGNAAARRLYRNDVESFREELLRFRDLIVPTSADEAIAWQEYRRGSVGSAGIVDHVSFAVMRRLGVVEVFTNDRHFAAAGFMPLF